MVGYDHDEGPLLLTNSSKADSLEVRLTTVSRTLLLAGGPFYLSSHALVFWFQKSERIEVGLPSSFSTTKEQLAKLLAAQNVRSDRLKK